METLNINTDLHCQGCVDKIAPILNADTSIKDWSVNLDGEIKRLKVTGERLSLDHINGLLGQAGYRVLDGSPAPKGNAFWRDRQVWRRSSFNTLNCLIGCSLGDFGMVVFLQAFYPQTPMMWQMILAIIAGLMTSIALETTILRFRERFNWILALQTAFGMSFISMVAMEIAMTTTDFLITGGKAAFDNPMYWLALAPALIVGFLTPLPYNYYKLKKYDKACH